MCSKNMASSLRWGANRLLVSAARMLFWVMVSHSTSVDFPRRFDAGSFVSSLSRIVWCPFVVFPCCSRSEEHTSELQSRGHLVCRLPLEKKKTFYVELYQCVT